MILKRCSKFLKDSLKLLIKQQNQSLLEIDFKSENNRMKLINSILSNLEKIHRLKIVIDDNYKAMSATDDKTNDVMLKTTTISARKISDELANLMKKLQNDFKLNQLRKPES